MEKLIAEGKEIYEKTELYRQKVNAIKTEVLSKYNTLIKNEKNYMRKVALYLMMVLEIYKKRTALSSLYNLYMHYELM
ncbi:MAG TPA: hypothetical protein PKD85_01755 [Saprospiraceae bacterium]|nr:hypothetical protein [Saprospiraceae bacterium]